MGLTLFIRNETDERTTGLECWTSFLPWSGSLYVIPPFPFHVYPFILFISTFFLSFLGSRSRTEEDISPSQSQSTSHLPTPGRGRRRGGSTTTTDVISNGKSFFSWRIFIFILDSSFSLLYNICSILNTKINLFFRSSIDATCIVFTVFLPTSTTAPSSSSTLSPISSSTRRTFPSDTPIPTSTSTCSTTTRSFFKLVLSER